MSSLSNHPEILNYLILFIFIKHYTYALSQINSKDSIRFFLLFRQYKEFYFSSLFYYPEKDVRMHNYPTQLLKITNL